MKHVLTAASAALALVSMFPAAAAAQVQASGDVLLHGFVAPGCGTVGAGGTPTTTFGGTIQLGELSSSTTGGLAPLLQNSTTNSPVAVMPFVVGCTGSAATVTISATRLSNPNPPALPDWSNNIDYTAEIKIALAVGGFATVTYTTAASPPAPVVQLIPDVFALVEGNFEVRVYGFAAENGPTSILVSGNYDSAITILVSPSI
jgi:hypothetical protein